MQSHIASTYSKNLFSHLLFPDSKDTLGRVVIWLKCGRGLPNWPRTGQCTFAI